MIKVSNDSDLRAGSGNRIRLAADESQSQRTIQMSQLITPEALAEDAEAIVFEITQDMRIDAQFVGYFLERELLCLPRALEPSPETR